MAKFKKGDPRPAGAGMKKGMKKKKTVQWEQLGDYLITQGAQKYIELIKGLPPEEFMERYEKIIEYFKPKQARVETDVTVIDTNKVIESLDGQYNPKELEQA